MAVGFSSPQCDFSDFTIVSSSPTESTALAAASLIKQTTSDVSSIWKIGSTLYALGGSFFNFSSYEIKILMNFNNVKIRPKRYLPFIFFINTMEKDFLVTL